DRVDRGSSAGAARPATCADSRTSARCGAALSGQAPLRDRLFGQASRAARGEEIVSRIFGALLGLALGLAAFGSADAASKIEAITSPGGIKAWLVRETSVPVIAVDYAFTGGANADPAGKPGVANMVGSLLDEG